MLRQRRERRLPYRSEQLAAREEVGGTGSRIRQALPRIVVERHPPAAPRPAPQPHRDLEHGELVGPGREPARPAKLIELAENGHRGIVRGLQAQIIEVAQNLRGKGATAPEGFRPGDAMQHRVQALPRGLARRTGGAQLREPAGRGVVEHAGCTHAAGIVGFHDSFLLKMTHGRCRRGRTRIVMLTGSIRGRDAGTAPD
jgi:hypothetical protein